MTQKPTLRAEVYALALCANKSLEKDNETTRGIHGYTIIVFKKSRYDVWS